MPGCAYHPDRPAMDRCAECARDICVDCRTDVAGKPVCASCVEAIRAKVAAEMASAPAVPPTPDTYAASSPQPANFGSAGGYTGGVPTGGPTIVHDAVLQEPPNPARLLVGIALGVAFGAIGAFLLKTFVYYTNFGISFLNIIVGGAVGYGVILGSGRRGLVTAIISAVLAFSAMMFSDYLLITSVLQDAFGSVARMGSIGLSDFVDIQKQQGVMHWVCVAIGVYTAFSMCIDKGISPAE